MAKTPERFLWAVRQLGLSPEDHVLEIGCGAGLFAEQIACTLDEGKLVAVDRSAAMIVQAKKRNQWHVKSKRVAFVRGDFLSLRWSQSFHCVVTFNVNQFFHQAPEAAAAVWMALRPGGILHVFQQAPYNLTRDDAAPLVKALRDSGFSSVKVHVEPMNPASVLMVRARRPLP